jgi:hypothetical protein
MRVLLLEGVPDGHLDERQTSYSSATLDRPLGQRGCRNPRRGSEVPLGFYNPASRGLSIRPYKDFVSPIVGSSKALLLEGVLIYFPIRNIPCFIDI